MAKKDLIINGSSISPGTNTRVKANIARLASGTLIDLPVYVFRSKRPGPVVLFSGGLHGDEINGIEIVRRMIEDSLLEKLHRGTVVAVPVMNIYGFLNFSREVPDGKDINRSFPGNAGGSLASRVAHFMSKQVLPAIDFGVDFHTGGASRFNFPQVRYAASDKNAGEIARAFGAPLLLESPFIEKSLRKQAFKGGASIIVYEGGESLRIDEEVIREGLNGAMRLLHHHKMIDYAQPAAAKTVTCTGSTWLRAKRSGIYKGLIKSGMAVNKGDVIGHITDPFGEFSVKIKSTTTGFVLGHNNMPVVNQGDALLHIGISTS